VLVTNKPNPNLNIGNDSSICPYQPITLNASAANAQSYRWFDGTVGPIYNHVGGGAFWVEILKDGCTYLDTVLLTNKLLPIVDLGPDKTICNTDTITLSTNTANAVKHLWSTGQTLAEIEVNNIGEYWISVTDNNGCYNTDTIKIDTFVSPFVFIGNDDAFCEGTSYTIVCDKVFNTYLWQDGSRNSSLTTVLGGKYYVEVTDNNNCKASDTIALTMYPRPTIFTNRMIKVCRQDTLLQIAGNFSSALWNDGTTAFQLLAKNPGEFSVEVTDTLGCKNKTEIKVISSCPASIYVPNVFSPNNDGSNDVFKAYITDVNTYNFKIYSRWGTLVFETTDFNESWDGTFEGTQAPNDAYIYLITYTGGDGISGTINGNVTLIR
jgi:gliding motility-associated-like protein